MLGLHCAFAGKVTSEPESKFTGSGKSVLVFSVAAIDLPREDGKRLPLISVTLWESLADEYRQVLAKGSPVYIEGSLTFAQWTGRDGQPRFSANCSAWRCELLGQIGERREPVEASRRER